MNKNFNYEDSFMGVFTDISLKKEEHLAKTDYRFFALKDFIKVKKGIFLDIGCGGGSFTQTVASYYPKAKLYGCDISRKAIFYANKMSGGKVKYAVIKNNKLPYKDNFFDVCVCLDVVEHVPDCNFFLSEISRVLKKHGLCYFAIPCEGQTGTLTAFFQKIKFGDQLTNKFFGHIHPEFTHQVVSNLLVANNFQITHTLYSSHLLSQILQFFQYFLPKILLELVLGAKRADRYADKTIIAGTSAKNKNDPFMLLRLIWLKLIEVSSKISFLELLLFKKMSFTSLKVLILAKNNK
jgi:2-polyprenyl-3-methyl-5-hydroxy-6-metoxy-1,4-benzoquinol methylase